MKVLITGGAGYIGTELVHKLEEIRNIEIIIYDNLSRKNYNIFLEGRFNSDRIKFIEGDILDSRKIKSLVQDVDVLVHLAAVVTTPFSDEELHNFEQVNHWGTSELVYHCEQSTRLKKFIYLSSSSVYGLSVDKEVFDENSIVQPTSHYGMSKLRGENEVELLREKKDTVIVRSANVFGYSRSMRFDSIINNFMFEAHFNNRINIHGVAGQIRPYISINKISEMLKTIILEKNSKYLQNLVEYNFSIDEIIYEGIMKVYPEIEVLYLNQGVKPRHLAIKQENNENNIGLFLQYLHHFRSKFTF